MTDSSTSFDPLVFLNIPDVPSEQKAAIRRRILVDIACFFIENITEVMTDEQLVYLEEQLPKVKSYEDILKLMKICQPNFETLRPQYLEKYKQVFPERKIL